MRITDNAILSRYQTALNTVRTNVARDQIRVATGKENQTPSDDPRVVADVKRLKNVIDLNEQFKKNIADGATDTRVYEETLENFVATLQTFRDTANDAVNPINGDKLASLGEITRQLIGDLVEISNNEFDGRFAFSGTLTTRNSLVPTGVETNNLPFELVEDPALVSAENPLGLRVTFKGNNEERRIKTSVNTFERVNVRAEEVFGAGGVAVFDNLVNIFNTISFKPDGTARTNTEPLTAEETNALQDQIRILGNSIDQVNSGIGRLGAVGSRLQAIGDQLTFENTRLEDLLSLREDADVIEAALALRSQESALEAALTLGPQVLQQSLLDFLR